jgi:hypothetical protein
MLHFGYPKYTDATILRKFIKNDAYMMEVIQSIPIAVTNIMSWWSKGIQ